MGKYILKRLGLGIVTLWVIITITFILMHSIPGGPFYYYTRVLAKQADVQGIYKLSTGSIFFDRAYRQ